MVSNTVIINAFCIIGIINCILIWLFQKINAEVTSIEEVDANTYIITVKRLWVKYEYVTDKNMLVYDIDRNIRF